MSNEEHTPASIAVWRLGLLRGGYLLLAAGMGSQVIPTFIAHEPWGLFEGATNAMMLALVSLSVLGLRYPLKMLPLLFWELIWKGTWMLAVALPLTLGSGMDPDTAGMAFACGLAVLIVPVIPWDYVWQNYVDASGDRWR